MLNKKVSVFLLLGVFMISLTSAMGIDNWVNYEDNDMKVRITNWLNLGEDLGTAELKSHKSVNEVKEVATGKNKTVMYYDMNFKEKDSLGEVEFINMSSGEIIEKDYHFVIWDTIYDEKNNYSRNCVDVYNEGNKSYYESCESVLVGTYIEERAGWIDLAIDEISKGKSRIGLVTDVDVGDKIDGIWTIAGKKIRKHATWTASLNVGLNAYWKLNETSGGTVDSTENVSNGSVTGATQGVPGIIGTAYSFDGNDYVQWADQNPLDITGEITINIWVNVSSSVLDATPRLLDKGANAGNYGFVLAKGSGNLPITSMGFYAEGSGIFSSTAFTDLRGDGWHMVTVAFDDSINDIRFYLDGISVGNETFTTNLAVDSSVVRMGDWTTGTDRSFQGVMDEVGLWSRQLSQSEVIQLYNEGSGITYFSGPFISITTTLNQPENNTLSNDATVDFNWTITPENLNITNWTLTVLYENSTIAHQHINTTINTNITTTVIHNDTLFLDETYIWNVESCGTDGVDDFCDLSVNWTFTLDTTPPEVNITYPLEGFIVVTPQQNITLNYTIEHPVGDLSNCFYNTTSNSTTINISCTDNTTSFLYPVSNPINLTIYVFGNDTASNLGSDNVTIYKDTTSPQINVTAPVGTLNYNYIGGSETLNVTSTDSGMDSCWYNYNGTNVSIEGCLSGIENSTNFILEENNLNMTIYANDTFGNTNSSFIEWGYILLEKSVTYSINITEGVTNQISVKVIIDEGSSITNSILNYGGTNYTTSVFYDGENYTIISSNAAPIVSSDTNYSFNFIVSVDDNYYNTTTNNQTVLNSDFGICGGISNDTLLNVSLFDEGTLADLIGDIELNADIISKTSGEVVESTNSTFSSVHSGAICLSPTSSYDLYYLDAEIRYFKDDYATELYYIQQANLSEYPRNLSLYSLNSNDSTEFTVTYKNNAFIFTEDVIIQLQRKYIGENIYRVVEAPLTSDGGKAILHIDLNTNKYSASVVKDGELLDFFDNIVFSCENELAGDCTYSLDGTVDPNNDVSIETITDFAYSISIDEDNQTVTVLFAVPSGTSSSINILLNQIDMFGNLTSCNTTIITSAGSITCDYTDTIEKSILELTISKDDVQLAVLSYVNDPDLDMDGMNFFIVFLFMISLVGMAISSPEWMILISVMVLIISGTMLLLKGMSLVMGLGAIAWVVIAAAIIILKMAKQEDR